MRAAGAAADDERLCALERGPVWIDAAPKPWDTAHLLPSDADRPVRLSAVHAREISPKSADEGALANTLATCTAALHALRPLPSGVDLIGARLFVSGTQDVLSGSLLARACP